MPGSYPAIFVLGSSINSFISILSILSIFVQVYKHSALDGCVDIVMVFFGVSLGMCRHCLVAISSCIVHACQLYELCCSGAVYRTSVMTLWDK